MQKAQKRRKNYIKALLNQTSFENGWNDEKIEQNSKSKFGHDNSKLLKQGHTKMFGLINNFSLLSTKLTKNAFLKSLFCPKI